MELLDAWGDGSIEKAIKAQAQYFSFMTLLGSPRNIM